MTRQAESTKLGSIVELLSLLLPFSAVSAENATLAIQSNLEKKVSGKIFY